MSLKDLVRAVQKDLPVTVRHERWMLANSDPVYSEAAIQFSDDFLRKRIGGNRVGRRLRFRASGMGKCARSRVFSRIGHKGISEDFSSSQANIFATGNFMHRKWQMAGITEGWIPTRAEEWVTRDGQKRSTRVLAEVPMDSEEYDLAGTADGFIWDGSLFEFKTINSNGWQWIRSKGVPDRNHRLQTAAYKLLDPTLTAASIVYENKDTGEWREVRSYFDDEIMQAVIDEIDELTHSIETQVLPPVLNKCSTGEGMEYRRCPYRDSCLKIKVWPKEQP